jgi:hypothetical protein
MLLSCNSRFWFAYQDADIGRCIVYNNEIIVDVMQIQYLVEYMILCGLAIFFQLVMKR